MVTECKYCGELVVWMQTVKGKKILVDAETCNENDTVYNKDTMKCHFETCTKQPEKSSAPSNGGYLEAKLDMIQSNINEILLILQKKGSK